MKIPRMSPPDDSEDFGRDPGREYAFRWTVGLLAPFALYAIGLWIWGG